MAMFVAVMLVTEKGSGYIEIGQNWIVESIVPLGLPCGCGIIFLRIAVVVMAVTANQGKSYTGIMTADKRKLLGSGVPIMMNSHPGVKGEGTSPLRFFRVFRGQ
jgi:hypothetical protein